jgi:hypothetical protein
MEGKRQMEKRVLVIAVLIIQFLFCSAAQAQNRDPMPEALEAMKSDTLVTVKTVTVSEWGEEENHYYAFEPNFGRPTTGFIIYPGAYVDPRSYAPAARAIAEKGYMTFIVKMPQNLAFYGPERANEIIEEYSGLEKWVIGGHSLGGVASCIYVGEYPEKIDGLVLWASYTVEDYRLDDLDLNVISIYGTNDGISTTDEILSALPFLPPDTQWEPIEGGNHTYFGWYGDGVTLQEEDNPATMTRQEQQDLVIKETLDFLGEISGKEQCVVENLLGEGDPRIETMRRFRDEVLAKTGAGKRIINLYYAGEAGATVLTNNSPAIQNILKQMIVTTVPVMEFFLKNN